MKLYQINFRENRPVSAQLLDVLSPKSMEIETRSGRRSIKWITLFADDEQEGISLANEVVDSIGNFLLPGNSRSKVS